MAFIDNFAVKTKVAGRRRSGVVTLVFCYTVIAIMRWKVEQY